MAGRVRLKLVLGIITAFVLTLTLFRSAAWAAADPVIYSAPDGFQVWSYAKAWNDQAKLKTVYDELLQNTHGEEFKLLTKVIIYPGPDPQGTNAAGRWFGVWKMDQGKPRLQSGRYIELYDGNKNAGIADIARTLAHEYGHHFTYYHYYKKESKLWANWRNSGLAQARKLKNNPKVGADVPEHRWLIQEIAAEDYVQLFGSMTAKQSIDFKDIAERLPSKATNITFTTDIFNYRPQENYEIPLAANLPDLREYWLKASGVQRSKNAAPSQIGIRLSEVRQIEGLRQPQYVFTWDQSSDETADLEYTLVRFSLQRNGAEEIYPLKTVYDGEELQAVMGSASHFNLYMWEPVPVGLEFFVVYVKDREGLVTSSKVLAVNFADKLAPSSLPIDDNLLLSGKWLIPRISVRGKLLDSQVKPVIRNGVMMAPLRSLSQELGATIEWEAPTQTVRLNKDFITMSLQIGNPEAILNEQKVLLNQAPEMAAGSMMVPLRNICQALGAEITWDPVLQLAQVELL